MSNRNFMLDDEPWLSGQPYTSYDVDGWRLNIR